jgi:hypothetical protein
MSLAPDNLLGIRKDNEMESRYKKLNILDLREVESEIDTLLSIVNLDTIDDQTFEYLNSLVKLAKSLGSVRSW